MTNGKRKPKTAGASGGLFSRRFVIARIQRYEEEVGKQATRKHGKYDYTEAP